MDIPSFLTKLMALVTAYKTQNEQLGVLTAENAALKLQIADMTSKLSADDAALLDDAAKAEALAKQIAELQAALDGVNLPTDPTVPVVPPVVDVPPVVPPVVDVPPVVPPIASPVADSPISF